MIFVPDTNLLVYAFDLREPEKRKSALLIIERLGDVRCHVGLQTVGEFFSACVRRLQLARDVATTNALLLSRQFITFSYDLADVRKATALVGEGVFSYWDGLLLTAAERAGCTHFLSEDMQDGFRFGGLEIVRTFSDQGAPNPRLMQVLSR